MVEVIIGLLFVGFFLGSLIYHRVCKGVRQRRTQKLDAMAYAEFGHIDKEHERHKIKSIAGRYASPAYRCPRCGALLVKRISGFGEFWGCSRFPDCRYTRDIGREDSHGVLSGEA